MRRCGQGIDLHHSLPSAYLVSDPASLAVPKKYQQIANVENSTQFERDCTKAMVDFSLLLLHCKLIYFYSFYSLHPSHLSFRSFLRATLKLVFLLSMFTAFTIGRHRSLWKLVTTGKLQNQKVLNCMGLPQRISTILCREKFMHVVGPLLRPHLNQKDLMERASIHRASFS